MRHIVFPVRAPDSPSSGRARVAVATAAVGLSLVGGALAPVAATSAPSTSDPGAGATTSGRQISTRIIIGRTTLPVAGRNIARRARALVVYSAPRRITPRSRTAVDVTVLRGRVTGVKVHTRARQKGIRVPTGGLVYSGVGRSAGWLRSTARVGSLVRAATGAATTPAPPTPAATGRVVKVMPLGDSITQAGGIVMGYKGYLLDKLVAARTRVDYVGSQVASGPSRLRDRQHEGHSGWQNSHFQPTVGGFVARYAPDVIVLHIGTNDIWSNVDADTAITRLRDVLSRIYAAKSNTHVVLAKIVRMDVGKDAAWQRYNSQIPGLVRAEQQRGHKISLADLSTSLTRADFTDGIHPTDTGHRKMANAFYLPVLAAVRAVR